MRVLVWERKEKKMRHGLTFAREYAEPQENISFVVSLFVSSSFDSLHITLGLKTQDSRLSVIPSHGYRHVSCTR